MTTSAWTDEQLFYSKDTYFPALLGAIADASATVELETYIFDMDRIGLLVVAAIRQAAERGVRVRLLLDGVGSLFTANAIFKAFEGSGVQIQVFHPFLRFRRFDKLNKRLHRKLCLLDRNSAFVGSYNITDNELRDTAAKIAGPECHALLSGFERRWQKARRRVWRIRPSYQSLVRFNETTALRRQWNNDIEMRLRSAKARIWITNAYFVPPLVFLDAMKFAARRGVDIRLLVTERSDHVVMKWIAETYYEDLLVSGVRIFEYKPCFLHAKTLVIDDWVLIGSSNFNHRSFFHDLELDIVLTHESSLKSMEDQYGVDLSQSTEITLDRERRHPFLYRLLRWSLLIFRNWV